MSFTVDYDKYYKEDKKACGDPFNEIIEFLKNNKKEGAKALDLGCGQGRDSIPMAKMGYSVTAVDVSEVGLKQLNQFAKKNKLNISTYLSDVVDFKCRTRFDAIVLDRVLHILPNFTERKLVLKRAASYLKKDGTLLIADTPQNIKEFKAFFNKHIPKLKITFDKKNYSFYKK